ncbi:MAG: polysaccharide deacetylase family protein [Chitinophagaceae bacterium]|nr:polysaccharide deacetylase family protein [Chitinophagaceae bacterium]
MFKKAQKHCGLILMYHHINTLESDEWQLAVSAKNFAEQLSVLSDFNVVSINEMADAVRAKSVRPNSIAISFDDGYEDNYSNAASLLANYRYPASFFLTNSIGNEQPQYWWDELERILLLSKHIPEILELNVRSVRYRWNLSGNWTEIISPASLSELAGWLRWKVPPSTRHALFVYISEWMKSLTYEEQQSVIEQLKLQCNDKGERSDAFKCISSANLDSLRQISQFEIGGHTATHIALTNFSNAIKSQSIHSNKVFLESILYQPVTGFAYPHGSYDKDSIDILQQMGFRYGCTTQEAVVTTEADPYKLPRFHAKDWNGRQFHQHIEEWMGK